MSATPCPVCGAVGNQACSTVTERDHKRRWKAEIENETKPESTK